MIIAKQKYAQFLDTELLLKYKGTGDQSYLTDLFLRYINLISGVCLKYLKEDEAAKDAVLNIYEELIHKTKTYEINNFKSWIYSVTKNYCVSYLKKNKIKLIELSENHEENWIDYSKLDAALEKENLFNQLERCIEGLPKEQNMAIRLFYLENKCYKEIVEVIGKDWNKIRSLIQNGKRNLKICMDAA